MQLKLSVRTDTVVDVQVKIKRTCPDQRYNHSKFSIPSANTRKVSHSRSSEQLHQGTVNRLVVCGRGCLTHGDDCIDR
jgi:hypothetical protein